MSDRLEEIKQRLKAHRSGVFYQHDPSESEDIDWLLNQLAEAQARIAQLTEERDNLKAHFVSHVIQCPQVLDDLAIQLKS